MPSSTFDDNSNYFLVIELPRKEVPIQEDPDEDDAWGIPLVHPSGFTSSWSANSKTQFDYEGVYDL